jgi:hypothetical protein
MDKNEMMDKNVSELCKLYRYNIINNIRNMPDEDKMVIIISLNRVLESIIQVIN